MQTIENVIAIESKTIPDLNKKIQIWLEEGYVPQGGISNSITQDGNSYIKQEYCVLMVKYKEPTPSTGNTTDTPKETDLSRTLDLLDRWS